MKIAFMGTPDFAVPTLQRLIESPHEVTVALTQPDRPAGRGRQSRPSPVKALAQERGILVEQPARLKGAGYGERLQALGVDVAVVAAYGLLLPSDVLEAPRWGCLNVHASLLPRWRGAAPIQRAIMAGDRQTGVTIMRMDAGLDTGPIIAQEAVDILADDDSLSVAHMLSVLGADMMIRTLDRLAAEQTLEATAQDEELATYAPKLEKEEGRIDWTCGVDEIICRIHALRPWPSAFGWVRERLVKIHEAMPVAEPPAVRKALDQAEDEAETETDPPSGMVVSLDRAQGPVVRVGDGYLLLTRVQPENKAVMGGGDWINGGGVKVGDRFADAVEGQGEMGVDGG